MVRFAYTGTCRLCKKGKPGPAPIKYAVRHYAHADCALEKWGAEFFDRLTRWQLEQFPALVAARAGLLNELEKRLMI